MHPSVSDYDDAAEYPRKQSNFEQWLRTGVIRERTLSQQLLETLAEKACLPVQERFAVFMSLFDEHMRLDARDHTSTILPVPRALLSLDEFLDYVELEDIRQISNTDLALTLLNGVTLRFAR